MAIHIITLDATRAQKDKAKNALDKAHWEYFAFIEEIINHVVC
jgi:hypothetical protein